jgi:hypothetical protein
MKNWIFILVTLIPLIGSSQDTTKATPSKDCKFNHEIGGNMTLFLKQVFNLSNTTLTVLPYDITYKLIRKNDKWAGRAGFGITMNNSSINTTQTTTSQNQSTITGPDPVIPTTNNSMNLFYRIGWECRHSFGTRIIASAGLDLAGQYGSSHSQNTEIDNNLPNSYDYLRTTDDISTLAYGGGPVAGLQFMLTKNLSIFTEMPLYFMHTSQKEVVDSYENSLQNFSTTYISEDNKQTQTIKSSKLSVTLPVTLYVALKF